MPLRRVAVVTAVRLEARRRASLSGGPSHLRDSEPGCELASECALSARRRAAHDNQEPGDRYRLPSPDGRRRANPCGMA